MILLQYAAYYERCTGRRCTIALVTLLIIASAGLLFGLVAAWLM